MVSEYFNKPFPRHFSSYDTSFVSGDSPVVLDLEATLKGISSYVVLYNDGAGSYKAEFSEDGTTYGDETLVLAGEAKGYFEATRKIKITWLANTAYRVEAF